MKNKKRWHRISGLMPYLLLPLLMAACDTTIKTDEAKIGEALTKKEITSPTQALQVDTAKSEVTWIGSKMTGRHNGIFPLKSGEIQLQNGKISSGRIIIDLAALQCTDKTINAESSNKLAMHLKSADFFDVEKHPVSTFEIVSVTPYDSLTNKEVVPQGQAPYSELKVRNPTHTITGNLTIKDKTKSITFPAKVLNDEKQLTAKANFNIDRTKWGLVYRSDKTLGDKTIHSSVNIGFNIIATPATDNVAE